MTTLFKIFAVALIFICCTVFIRNYRPEYVLLLRFSAIIIMAFFLLGEAKPLFNELESVFSGFDISSDHLKLLLKVGLTAVISDFIIDTLKESGDNSVAGIVALSSRVVIFSLTIPILKGLIIICSDLIK